MDALVSEIEGIDSDWPDEKEKNQGMKKAVQSSYFN